MPETEVFDELVTDLDNPVFVVTAAADGEPSGCLVGFASQSSIHPPRFTVWISEVNHTAGVAARARSLVVHVLREHDEHLAALFGGETGDRVDKLAEVAWEPGPTGRRSSPSATGSGVGSSSGSRAPATIRATCSSRWVVSGGTRGSRSSASSACATCLPAIRCARRRDGEIGHMTHFSRQRRVDGGFRARRRGKAQGNGLAGVGVDRAASGTATR